MEPDEDLQSTYSIENLLRIDTHNVRFKQYFVDSAVYPLTADWVVGSL